MEKRESIRHNLNTSIVCSYLSAVRFSETFQGRMKNCCCNGIYAELQAQLKTGTILVVRTTGRSFGYSKEDGFRSVALAEVKWSQRKPVQGDVCYGTGLKYLVL